MKAMAIPGRDPVKRVLRHFDFLINASRRELIKGALVMAGIAGLSILFSSNYGIFLDIAETRCMPEYLYLGYPKAPILQRGDIISYVATDKTMLGLFTGKRMAKIIAGLPGDHVVTSEDGAFVNGARVGERSPLTLANMELRRATPINMNRKLQPGELFVVGTLPRSFDSRYWGVLPAQDVDRMVKPVF